MDDSNPKAIVQRLFLHAERRLGGPTALGAHLGLRPAELAPYLTGTDVPPAEILLRTVSLVLEDVEVVLRGYRESAWRSLLAGYRSNA